VNIKNRQQLLTVLAGIAIVLFFSDRFIFTPLTKTWQARSDRIAELKKSIAQGELLVDRAPRISSQWNNMRTNTLPVNLSAAENNVLKAFDRWKDVSRITISSIKPQWKRSADDYMVLECRADGFGSIEAISRFLYEMEKDPLALHVDSVELNTRDINGQQLALGLQVSGLLLTPEDQ
jgi:hypothetical protein